MTGPAPEPPEVARALSSAVQTYLDHLAVERGLAGNTLSSYRRDLRRYVVGLTRRGVGELSGVTEPDVAAFLADLREGDADHLPLAASSAARAVVAVRGLHRFAVREGLATLDPSSDVRPPTPPKRLPKAISVDEVEPTARCGQPCGRPQPDPAEGQGAARGALRHGGAHLRGGRPGG